MDLRDEARMLADVERRFALSQAIMDGRGGGALADLVEAMMQYMAVNPPADVRRRHRAAIAGLTAALVAGGTDYDFILWKALKAIRDIAEGRAYDHHD